MDLSGILPLKRLHRMMPERWGLRRIQLWLVLGILGLVRVAVCAQEEPVRSTGLLLSVTGNGETDESDLRAWPNVQLYVSEGTPPSPFVQPGPFTAVWEGFVNSELRSTYGFYLDFRGELELEINGKVHWSGASDGKERVATDTLRLGKGENALRIRYSTAQSGDAFVRLYWSGRDMPTNPIPYEALTHAPTAALENALLRHRGRDLFTESRCSACHTVPTSMGGMPELAMDAPRLDGIGTRRQASWLADWLLDPASLRAHTAMPQLFHGPDAAKEAEAVAVFLASLKSGDPLESFSGDAEQGKHLYETLRCQSCHEAPSENLDKEPSAELMTAIPGGSVKISQKGVRNKFEPGALADFLLEPEKHFSWIRMPNFKLTPVEAGDLAAYLESVADAPKVRELEATPDILKRGRELVGSVGCLNCHALEGMQTRLNAPTLAALKANLWTGGCLDGTSPETSTRPHYSFSQQDIRALQAFAETDRSSLTRHTSADFLLRHVDRLNCRECHGAYQEEFPSYDILGGKLKPEWASRFIAGQIEWKPRPWLEARMPAFPAYAQGLGEGLATLHGWPEKTSSEPDPDPEDVTIGRALIGTSGFSCVSCHGVGEFGATQVFEAPGTNLAHAFERLQWDYFQRWILNPMRVDPTTKMPGFFDDEGNSPLTEYYEGVGPRTIRGMWEYMKLGSKMPLPE